MDVYGELERPCVQVRISRKYGLKSGKLTSFYYNKLQCPHYWYLFWLLYGITHIVCSLFFRANWCLWRGSLMMMPHPPKHTQPAREEITRSRDCAWTVEQHCLVRVTRDHQESGYFPVGHQHLWMSTNIILCSWCKIYFFAALPSLRSFFFHQSHYYRRAVCCSR